MESGLFSQTVQNASWQQRPLAATRYRDIPGVKTGQEKLRPGAGQEAGPGHAWSDRHRRRRSCGTVPDPYQGNTPGSECVFHIILSVMGRNLLSVRVGWTATVPDDVQLSLDLIMALTALMSARPCSLGFSWPITLPISFIEDAPVSLTAASISAAISSSSSCLGR